MGEIPTSPICHPRSICMWVVERVDMNLAGKNAIGHYIDFHFVLVIRQTATSPSVILMQSYSLIDLASFVSIIFRDERNGGKRGVPTLSQVSFLVRVRRSADKEIGTAMIVKKPKTIETNS